MVHPTPGQFPPFPALDDGGSRRPGPPGPHPDLHGDTNHCVRGLEGPVGGGVESGGVGSKGVPPRDTVSLWCFDVISLLPPPFTG